MTFFFLQIYKGQYCNQLISFLHEIIQFSKVFSADKILLISHLSSCRKNHLNNYFRLCVCLSFNTYRGVVSVGSVSSKETTDFEVKTFLDVRLVSESCSFLLKSHLFLKMGGFKSQSFKLPSIGNLQCVVHQIILTPMVVI